MAAYADSTFYRDEYIGRECEDDTELSKWLSRASDDVDILTLGRIDVNTLSAAALVNLKKATCAQAEQYVINGDEPDDDKSFSLGSYSATKSEDADKGAFICDRASRYLFAAGLSFRGVRVCGR